MTEPRYRVCADATALIGLARIDRLDILTLLSTPIYVTAQVWAEIAVDPEKPGVGSLQHAREQALLQVVTEGNAGEFPQLDSGEATVLSAAAAARAAVIVDERRARALLSTDSRLRDAIPQATGIVGLILLAKRRGYVQAVRPLLDALIQQNFWIAPAFYQDILRAAGEL